MSKPRHNLGELIGLALLIGVAYLIWQRYKSLPAGATAAQLLGLPAVLNAPAANPAPGAIAPLPGQSGMPVYVTPNSPAPAYDLTQGPPGQPGSGYGLVTNLGQYISPYNPGLSKSLNPAIVEKITQAAIASIGDDGFRPLCAAFGPNGCQPVPFQSN